MQIGERTDNSIVPTLGTTDGGVKWYTPRPYFEFDKTPHREFVIVFHDEPEFVGTWSNYPYFPSGTIANTPSERARTRAGSWARSSMARWRSDPTRFRITPAMPSANP